MPRPKKLMILEFENGTQETALRTAIRRVRMAHQVLEMAMKDLDKAVSGIKARRITRR